MERYAAKPLVHVAAKRAEILVAYEAIAVVRHVTTLIGSRARAVTSAAEDLHLAGAIVDPNADVHLVPHVPVLRLAPARLQPRRVSSFVASACARQAALFDAASGIARARGLTPREEEVLRAFALGCDRASLAEALGIEETSVRTHVRRICAKLEIPRIDGIHRFVIAALLERVAPFDSVTP